ncbi:MAG: YhgE/Pip family protein, partial [Streptococcaceae bacterium]|nr:YhgE/Pip family protein [Streptococcaceae bacterium]
MIKNEWKLIAKNKFLWLVMLALVLIPVLYNVIFLSSLWDPYGKIQDLPVAVVNEDKSATLNGKKVTLGADLSENLKKSKTLDYSFVSADKAKNGLADGRYYMVVTFPEDLSSSASSIMDKTPKKATIRYETSKGHNFISSKMSESAMEKLQLSVTQDITKQYATTIFDNLSNLKTGMATAADGAGKLATGSSQAKSGSAQLSSGLTTAASSMLTFTNGAKQLSSGLTDYTNGVATLGQGTQQLSSGGAQLTTGAEKLAQGVQQLSDATTLSDAEKTQLAQLSSGLTAFNDGIQNGSGNAAQLTALLSDMAANAQAILSAEAAQTQAVHATSAYQSLTAPQQSEIDTALTQNSGAASAQKILQDVQNLSAALTTLQTNQTQLQQSAAQLLPAANTALGNLSTGLASAHTA